MPTFSFQCLKCEHEFDRFVPNSKKIENIQCPVCECPEWQQLVTSFANYHIKGDNSASVTPKNKAK